MTYAHTPLIAFAVTSGVMPLRQRAIAVATLLWIVNQLIGFGLRGYPLAVTALTWVAVMGLGNLRVVAFTSWQPSFARTQWLDHTLWFAISDLVGFGLYSGAHPTA